jgi:hypothetical protein
MARIPLPDGPGNERSRLWSLSPAFRDAAGTLAATVYEGSSLPIRERELVRFLVARLNGCPI